MDLTESLQFLVGMNRLLFKTDSKVGNTDVHNFGIDHGDGLFQICKIFVNDNCVYVFLSATFDEKFIGDPAVKAYFDLFRLTD